MISPLEYKRNGWLASASIKEDDIYLILKSLNPEKAHGWDNISIRMIQVFKKAMWNLYNFFGSFWNRVYTQVTGRKVT